MKKLIIQTSPQHTCSTFLINALYGLIPELANKKIIGSWIDKFESFFDNTIVVKDHNINIDELINKYKNKYELFFVCSERKEKDALIDQKYKSYNNVVVFDYNELNETEENTIPIIMQNIHDKINNMLGVEVNVESGINRINLMNTRYEEIKDKPFSYIDPFFEIHGSHRNRKVDNNTNETKNTSQPKITKKNNQNTHNNLSLIINNNYHSFTPLNILNGTFYIVSKKNKRGSRLGFSYL